MPLVICQSAIHYSQKKGNVRTNTARKVLLRVTRRILRYQKVPQNELNGYNVDILPKMSRI